MDPTVGSITTQFDPRMAALLGWVVVMVKVLIDWIKTTTTLPTWAPPALAVVSAFCVLFLLMLALGIPLSPQLIAQAALSALVATVLAIGQTALQARTKPSDTMVSAVTDELLRRRDMEKIAAVEADEKRREPIFDAGLGREARP